jgi:hypothetical protein
MCHSCIKINAVLLVLRGSAAGGGSLDQLAAPTHGTECCDIKYRAASLMGASSWPLRGVVTGKQVEENGIGRESSMHWVVRKQATKKIRM